MRRNNNYSSTLAVTNFSKYFAKERKVKERNFVVKFWRPVEFPNFATDFAGNVNKNFVNFRLAIVACLISADTYYCLVTVTKRNHGIRFTAPLSKSHNQEHRDYSFRLCISCRPINSASKVVSFSSLAPP